MIIHGDCLEQLKVLPDNSVDSVVTDPPYGLSFMGKKWDYDVPSQEVWAECLRVLKPGGYLLAFAGTRTQHRMAVRIEDAGFEIRDMIAWVYGSGFPKSLNIGKAVKALQETGGSSPRNLRKSRMGRDYEPTGQKDYRKGRMFSSEIENDSTEEEIDNEWEGWGTALKPALEPITVARKPLGEKTVAENVLKWGVGGINIDGCRVGTEEIHLTGGGGGEGTGWGKKEAINEKRTGRFPANFIHDGSSEVLSLFPGEEDKSASRFFYCAKASKSERNRGLDQFEEIRVTDGRKTEHHVPNSRTTPKKNFHPTVKPIALMRHLCKLVTPKGGTVLDPFTGSGTTGIAAKEEGYNFIGIEREPEYVKIAEARISAISQPAWIK